MLLEKIIYLKDTVRTRMKRTDPRNPPRMVMYSLDANCERYNCIPANSSTESVVDRRKEMPLDTAEITTKVINNNSHSQ